MSLRTATETVSGRNGPFVYVGTSRTFGTTVAPLAAQGRQAMGRLAVVVLGVLRDDDG
jgi:hypothetical protein